MLMLKFPAWIRDVLRLVVMVLLIVWSNLKTDVFLTLMNSHSNSPRTVLTDFTCTAFTLPVS